MPQTGCIATPDVRLRGLREAGSGWVALARALGLGRPRARRHRFPAARRPLEYAARPPRCAGHPETWGMLIEGTVLQGTPYPFPVFDEENKS